MEKELKAFFFQGFHYQSLGKCYWFANVLTNYTLLVVERFQLPSYIINITKDSVAFHIYCCFAMRKVVVTYSHVLYLGHFIQFMKFFAGLSGLDIKLRTCLSYQALWSRKCTWNIMALTLSLSKEESDELAQYILCTCNVHSLDKSALFHGSK